MVLQLQDNNSINNTKKSHVIFPEEQLDLFTPDELNQQQSITEQEKINRNIIPIKKNVENIVNNQERVFLINDKIKFFNINFSEDENNFFITFLVTKNIESNHNNTDLKITITLNKTNKYNNILVTQEGIKDLSFKLELIKYFLTAQGFHNLMSVILWLNNVPQDLLNIKYNHKKYWTAESFYNKEKVKYKWEKLNLWKIWISHNHFPELYLLKDNSSVNFEKDNFDFKIELEFDKKVYTVSWIWLKTINNTWDHSESSINIDITEINIDPHLEDRLVSQIKDHIIYYIQEL